MTTRRKATTDKVPAEVAFCIQHGRASWRLHPEYESASDVALNTYLLCGRIINIPNAGRELWQKYRSELMKRPGIKTWWAYAEYENA